MYAVLGEPDGPSKETVRGLSAVLLGVENVIPDEYLKGEMETLNAQFVHDAETFITNNLNKNGMRLLTEAETVREPGCPVLSVSTYIRKSRFTDPETDEPICILAVFVELFQVVTLAREPHQKASAPVWGNNFTKLDTAGDTRR